VNNKTPALTAPPWLLQEISRAPREKAEPIEGFEPDSPSAVEGAREWLVNHAPEAIEGVRNATSFQVACRVRELGVEEETCLALMSEHWNQGKVFPPLDAGELEQTIANAYQYATSALGAASPEAQFGAVELESTDKCQEMPENVRKSRLFIRSFEESRKRSLKAIASPLIKKFLGRGEMSVLYGESGVGKTFIALDLAFHIASGRDWNGHKVCGGPVVYVAAEAGETINARIEAIARQYKVNGSAPPLGVIPCLVDLFNPNADLKPLIDLILDWGKAHGKAVELVTLDTLARVMGAGDENAARDMGLLVRAIDQIRVATGAHVMVVHHAGKNTAKGARGSSALRAATDTEIEIEGATIKMRKQRSWELARAIGFQLDTVEIGEDTDGDTVTSCVVRVGAAVDFGPQLTPEQEEWIDQLEAFERKWQKDTGSYGLRFQFTTKTLAEAWGLLLIKDAAKKTIRRRVGLLAEYRRLEETATSTYHNRVWALQPEGRESATDNF
jgi:hypothetical protein